MKELVELHGGLVPFVVVVLTVTLIVLTSVKKVLRKLKVAVGVRSKLGRAIGVLEKVVEFASGNSEKE